jgi:hypothetical protein
MNDPYISVVEGSQLSVKIDHFPDVVAKGYLAKNNWYGDAVQVCGRRWRLKVHLIGVDLLCPWAQKGNPPKHMDCCLEMLPVVIGMTI